MRSSPRIGAAVLVAVSILAACSSSSKSTGTTSPTASTTATTAAPGTTTAAPTPTTKPAPRKRVAPTSFAQLAVRIITKVPAGFVRQTDRVGDTGPSNLAKAIKDDGSPNAKKRLQSEGFVRGYQRLWTGPAGAQILVFVYQFKTRVGAREDFARATHGYVVKPPPNTHKFVVTGLPRGQAFGLVGSEKDTSVAVIYFTSGVYSLQIDCNGPKPAGLQARATSIARDQLHRL